MQNMNGQIEPITTSRGGGGFITKDGVFSGSYDSNSGAENGDGAYRIRLKFNSYYAARTGYNRSGQLIGSDVTHGKQIGVKYIIKVL